MVRLMNRSIDWLERWALESGNRFLLNRRGYIYFTANPTAGPIFSARPDGGAGGRGRGAGARRSVHRRRLRSRSIRTALSINPTGLIYCSIDRSSSIGFRVSIRMIAAAACAALRLVQRPAVGHVPAGASARAGVRLINDRIDRVHVKHNRVEEIHLASARSISTRAFVNAAGPFLNRSDSCSAWNFR